MSYNVYVIKFTFFGVNSISVRKFTELFNYHCNTILEHFYPTKKDSLCASVITLSARQPLSASIDFSFLDISYK